jgi:hypothetical protein
MSDEICNLIARKFIARQDVKAIQFSRGYMPHVADASRPEETRIPWRRADILAHLDCRHTFGHYLINTDDQCKLFAFDVDLEKEGWLPSKPHPILKNPEFTDYDMDEYYESFAKVDDLRSAWQNRAHPGRYHMKLQFHNVAHMLCRAIHDELELPCAAAYSGGKGIHVYAFTGLISAHEAREGARIVLDSLGKFEPVSGDIFFKFKDQEPLAGYPNVSIEVFPKQDSLTGKNLGNLMRLPLGRNLKNRKDPTFFMDLAAPLAEMKPVDPVWAMTEGAINPWKKPGE